MFLSTASQVVLLLTIIITLGALSRTICKKLKIPYAPVVLFLGVAFGLCTQAISNTGMTLQGLFSLKSGQPIFSPDLILFAILPILFFNSSFNKDAHVLRRNLGGMSLLAIPTQIISMVLVAFFLLAVTGNGGDRFSGWPLALTFGALIAAAESSHVKEILRRAAIAKRVEVLIEGENFLSSALAAIFFVVLAGFVFQKTELSFFNVARDFLWVVLGGVAVGSCLSMVISTWMARLFKDNFIKVSLMVVGAYLAMVISESVLNVSGIMAIITMGLWMSHVGYFSIGQETAEFLRKFWNSASQFANTFVFFMAGMVLSTEMQGFIEPKMILLSILIYVAVMAVRMTLSFLFQPALSVGRNQISWQESLVIGWSGLRGGLSLALALAISQNTSLPLVIRNQILFVAVGVVLISFFVNGTTLSYMLRFLGLDKNTPIHALAKGQLEQAILSKVEEKVKLFATDSNLKSVLWCKIIGSLEQRKRLLSRKLRKIDKEHLNSPESRLITYWKKALTFEKEALLKIRAQGLIDENTLRSLTYDIDWHFERLLKGDMAIHRNRFEEAEPWIFSVNRYLFGKPIFSSTIKKYYELVLGQSHSSSYVLQNLKEIPLQDIEMLLPIQKSYEEFLKASKEAIEGLRSEYPAIIQSIEMRIARTISQHIERDEYLAECENGSKGRYEVTEGLFEAEKTLHKLALAPLDVEESPDITDYLREIPMFRHLDENLLEKLADVCQEKEILKDSYLFHQGERGYSVYVILKGAAQVLIENESSGNESDATLLDVVGAGHIIGEMSILTGSSRNVSIKASTDLTVVEIHRDVITKLAETYPSLNDEIWKSFSRHVLHKFSQTDPNLGRLSLDQLNSLLDKRKPMPLKGGKTFKAPEKVSRLLALSGEIDIGGKSVKAPALVNISTGEHFAALNDSRVILLPEYDEKGVIDVAFPSITEQRLAA